MGEGVGEGAQEETSYMYGVQGGVFVGSDDTVFLPQAKVATFGSWGVGLDT